MITDAEDGSFVASYTAYGSEFEVRRANGRFFAVFPNEEVTVLSEGKEARDEAAYAGKHIAFLLS
jgi:hypothetical protein